MKQKVLLLSLTVLFVVGFISCSKTKDSELGQAWLMGKWSLDGPQTSELAMYKDVYFDTQTKGRFIDWNNISTGFNYSYPKLTTVVPDTTWQITKRSDMQISIGRTKYYKLSN
jgi:hypothetical protein